MAVWLYLIIMAVIKCVSSEKLQVLNFDDIPLSKSLGLSIEKFNDLLDARLNQEYMKQYQEVMRANRDSFQGFDDDDQELESGERSLDLIKEGFYERRHSPEMRSVAGRRRARSQALRRDKLNTQSLRSHMDHSRHSGLERKLAYLH